MLRQDLKNLDFVNKYTDDGFHLYQETMTEPPTLPKYIEGRIQFMFIMQVQMGRLLAQTINHIDATLRVLSGDRGKIDLKVSTSIQKELQEWLTEREASKKAQRQYIK